MQSALYQKVSVPLIKDNSRHNYNHHHISGSLSTDNHQSLEGNEHLSSETSDEDVSQSISSSISEQALLHSISSHTNSSSGPPLLTHELRPRFPISRRTLNTVSSKNIRYRSPAPNKRYKSTNAPPPSPCCVEDVDASDSNLLLSIVPSEHELQSSLETVRGNICTIRKMSDSERARKYTSSSELSIRPTNHLVIPPPQTPTERRRISNTNTNHGLSAPSQSVLNSERDDKVSTWSYAYSYASNEINERKTMDAQQNVLIRPALKNEMQPKLQSIQASETNQDLQRPSLYSGFVGSPIEIQQEMVQKTNIMGPMLLYQTRVKTLSKNKKDFESTSLFALPIQSVQIDIDIAAETAFMEMNIVFVNNSEKQIKNALFVLPTVNGTIRNISVIMDNETLGEDGTIRSIQTVLVDSDGLNNAIHIDDSIFKQSLDDYICDLFRFPIVCIESHDSIKICSKWHQILEFNEGRYHLNIPLQFGHHILPQNVRLCEIMHLNIRLNSFFGSSIKFGSDSHRLIVKKTLYDSKQIHLYGESFENCTQSKDIHIAYYYADCDDITGTVLMDKEKNNAGHFILYINPITDEKHMNKSHCFGRDIIFLLDRSASMKGVSYIAAIEALNNVLDDMSSSSVSDCRDTFGIVCFNETQVYFKHITESESDNREACIMPPKYPLFEANAQHIESAKRFIANCAPCGGTDIVTPLKWALGVLDDIYCDKRARSNTVKSIPFVILITDGSDYQAKQMMCDMHGLYRDIRVLTFGIGMYCNHYFLRLLSLKSRGWSNSAMCGNNGNLNCNMKRKMQSLISSCYAPILKDLCIEDDVTHEQDIQLYSQSDGYIKDIFLNGTPIVIYGEYKNNKLPQILSQTNNRIRVSGICINGEAKVYEFKVRCNNNYFSIPLNKICLKQQLNEISSLFWFNEELCLKTRIVNLCIKENVSSEHTLMASSQYNETDNVTVIGVANKLFGNPNIDLNLSHCITDDLNDIHAPLVVSSSCCCCCCDCSFHKNNTFLSFLHSLCSCCACCKS